MARQRKRTRTVLIAVPAFLALVALVIVVAELTVERDDPAVITDVAPGETATLSNGTTVTASELRPADGGAAGDLLLTDVRVCGGGPTEVEDTTPDARNYVSPERFVLDGTPHETVTTTIGDVEPLPEVTLAEGDCLDGTVAFVVPPEVPDVGVAVRFRTGLGDQITWR